MSKIGERAIDFDEESGEQVWRFAIVVEKHRVVISHCFTELPIAFVERPKFEVLMKRAKEGKGDYSAMYYGISEMWVPEERFDKHMKEAEDFLKKHPSGEWITNEKYV